MEGEGTGGDWSAITEAGTVKTRVEIRNAGNPSSPAMYSVDAPGSVSLEMCPKDLTIDCPTVQTGVETSIAGTPLGDPRLSPVATGSCGPISASCTPPRGSESPTGVTPIICEARDSCENLAWCAFKVTISRAPPLAITCPANVIMTATTNAGEAVTYSPPTTAGG